MNEEIEDARNTDDEAKIIEDRFFERCDGTDCYDPGIHEWLIELHRQEQDEARRTAESEGRCAPPSPVLDPYAPYEEPSGDEVNEEVSAKDDSACGDGQQGDVVCRWCDQTDCTEECVCPDCLEALRDQMAEEPDDDYDEYAAMEAAQMRAEAGWNY
jgi:hypothetical protein